MADESLAVVILAAGQGTRMHSSTPKVLHELCGKPMIRHTIAMARELGAARIVAVAGFGIDAVREAVAGDDVRVVEQREQRGTAHAALQAREALADHDGPVLVMNGDHPLYRAATLRGLLDARADTGADVAILVTQMDDPTGYGRVVRGPAGRPERIVEERDADAATRAVHEVNLGAYVGEREALFDALARVGNSNAQGEYYLTDLVEITVADGGSVVTSTAADPVEAMGINDRAQLALAEREMRARINAHWMREGVTFVDPEATYVDMDCEIGPDTILAPGVCLRRGTRVGTGCRIDAGVVVEGSRVGDGTWLKPHCYIEDSRIGSDCILGPSAHLRPDVDLGDGCRIGNFVELKNSRIGPGTKADHLSYIGDADIGAGVTFACGAITVNYDGRAKHRTEVGDRAFIGCNANLIAPISVRERAFVAAGTTVTEEVDGGSLAVGRARQRNIEGWRDRKFGPED